MKRPLKGNYSINHQTNSAENFMKYLQQLWDVGRNEMREIVFLNTFVNDRKLAVTNMSQEKE